MTKNWKIKEPDLELQKRLTSELKISPIISQLLINRGLRSPQEIEDFLNTNLTALHNPFLLKDMEPAIRRIKNAISTQERIMIYGDYDVDGVTSVAVMLKVFTKLGALQVLYHIPNKLKEGYSLNKAAIDEAHQKKVTLLITVDCGIGNIEEVKYAAGLGIDTIIIDHHQPIDNSIPEAVAVINPKRFDCPYPYKYLAGVGLVFKLIQALIGQKEALSYLDLITLGTIADLAPLTGENRIIVKNGLSRITNSRLPGIKALIEISNLAGRDITVRNVGYALGPRLNAAGRLGSAESSLRLLLTSEDEEARTQAEVINRKNKERQKIGSRMFKETIARIEEGKEINFKFHKVIILWDENWHSGINGIIASRVAERYCRPAIIISTKDGIGRGSGRSVKNFHLLNAIKKCGQFLEKFGGHKYAIGLTISERNLSDFREMANLVISEQLSAEELMPEIDVDMELPLEKISGHLLEEIENLRPFGFDNPQPVFLSRKLTLKRKPEIVGERHLKMWVSDGDVTYPAIWYGSAEFFSSDWMAKEVSLVYSPVLNNWQGKEEIQLEVRDVKLR